ncbi:MAG: hypothetical protein EAY75_01510, partial [Bacteroidetes bacterium]
NMIPKQLKIKPLSMCCLLCWLLSIALPGEAFAQNQSGVYGLTIDSLSRGKIRMSNFASKITLIWLVDSANLKPAVLAQFDSLCVANQQKVVGLIVPCADGGTLPTDGKIAKLIRDHTTIVRVAAPGFAKKANGQKQHKLLKWLSHKDDNRHFDFDFIRSTNHVFVINTKGDLVGHYVSLTNFSNPLFTRVFAKLN